MWFLFLFFINCLIIGKLNIKAIFLPYFITYIHTYAYIIYKTKTAKLFSVSQQAGMTCYNLHSNITVTLMLLSKFVTNPINFRILHSQIQELYETHRWRAYATIHNDGALLLLVRGFI